MVSYRAVFSLSATAVLNNSAVKTLFDQPDYVYL